MSHPIRPESYIAMDNFYTATVYSKGAEVIRMYQTLLTPEGFRKGMDLYFERHDGSAVTCDDFRAAMADANGVNLDQFENWYLQNGTPTLSYSSSYDPSTSTFTLTLTQSSPTNPSNKPFHIPVSFGIIDSSSGEELLPTEVLELKEESSAFTFKLSNVAGNPVPSILRGFSAPVKLINENVDEATSQLQTLAAYDTDGFNRWEAGQKIFSSAIFAELDENCDSEALDAVLTTFQQSLTSDKLGDDSIRAYNLMLPTEGSLAEDLETIEPVKLREARGTIKKHVAKKFKPQFQALYTKLTDEMKGVPFAVDSKSIGRRR